MRLLVISCVALVLGLASPAGAAQFTGPGAEAAHNLKLHVPGPAGQIYVQEGGCPNQPHSAGCAFINPSVLYVRWLADEDLLAHELGHFFDVFNLSDAERATIQKVLGFPASKVWRDQSRYTNGDLYCEKTPCVSEIFADAYMACGMGYPAPRHNWERPDWATSYGFNPTRQQYRRICRMIRAYGGTS